MTTPTDAQIDAVLAFLPLLQQAEFVPLTWHVDEIEKGVINLPWEERSKEISDMISALYDQGFIEGCDWTSWQDMARVYVENPTELAKADFDTLKKLLTTHIRKDRFCEGHFSEMIRCGHIRGVFERLAELRKTF